MWVGRPVYRPFYLHGASYANFVNLMNSRMVCLSVGVLFVRYQGGNISCRLVACWERLSEFEGSFTALWGKEGVLAETLCCYVFFLRNLCGESVVRLLDGR